MNNKFNRVGIEDWQFDKSMDHHYWAPTWVKMTKCIFYKSRASVSQKLEDDRRHPFFVTVREALLEEVENR